jgi:uncharacterized damage-inducible protein DinB
MQRDDAFRGQITDLLSWKSAHVEFERVVKNVPPEYRGMRPSGAPYSLWELLEHMRLAQRDILEFCRSAKYASPRWPEDFWPPDPAPAKRDEWQRSIDGFHRDRRAMVELIGEQDLMSKVPGGEGQTFLREALLIADHNAYHIGQMVLVRRLLGIWPP